MTRLMVAILCGALLEPAPWSNADASPPTGQAHMLTKLSAIVSTRCEPPVENTPAPSPSRSNLGSHKLMKAYALKSDPNGVKNAIGQIDIYNDGRLGSTISVSLPCDAFRKDITIQVVDGKCGHANSKPMATLKEMPHYRPDFALALDLQNHDHIIWVTYRQWAYSSKANWRKFTDHGLSVIATGALTDVELCGNLAHDNEERPLPGA